MTKRCIQILEMLNKNDSLDVAAIVHELGVSAVTVRKDLALLEERGLLRRQHGLVRASANDIAYRMTFDYAIKQRIARRASGLVRAGESVMIESGSTCAMLAEELVKKMCDITIITNSAFIAAHVRKLPGARIVLLGGAYDAEAQVTVGPLVGMCAEAFFVDKFFIGTDGYDPIHGFSSVDLQRAAAVRDMAKRAEHSIILTDSSKFNRRGVVSLMHPHEVSMLVTDAVSEDCRLSLEENGVDIVIA